MKNTYIILLLLACIPAQLFAVPEQRYELYEYDGMLDVEIPYKKVLATERFHARLIIENWGRETIKVTGKGANTFTQLVWIPWDNGKLVESPGHLIQGSYKKSPTETFSDFDLDSYHGTIELKPGMTYDYAQMSVQLPDASLLAGQGDLEAELRPALYGGKGKVIYGKPFKIKFIPKGVRSFKKVYETTYDWQGGQRTYGVYEVPIDGEIYLFNQNGVRFCRIPPKVNYSFSFKVEGIERILTVHFDDTSLEPHIFSCRMYELVSASRATVPWLFDKPGGDKVVGPKTREGRVYKTPLKTSRSKPINQSTETVKKKGAEQNEHANKPWIMISLTILGTLLAVFLYARKKNR